MAEPTENLQPTTPPPAPSKPEVKKVQAKEETSASEQSAQFATEYFQALGLAVCPNPKCGSKKQTDGFGKVICAIGTIKKECPMLAAKEDK